MNLLAIDTTSMGCLVVLSVDGQLFSQANSHPRQQAQTLLPLLNALMIESNCTLQALNAIAYSAGPGSFTGSRIATAVTQALSFALDRPTIPLSTLTIRAQTAYYTLYPHLKAGDRLLVTADAGGKYVYVGLYCLNEAGVMQLIGLEEKIPRDQIECFNRDGHHRVTDQMLFSPSAGALNALAAYHFSTGASANAFHTLPIYL